MKQIGLLGWETITTVRHELRPSSYLRLSTFSIDALAALCTPADLLKQNVRSCEECLIGITMRHCGKIDEQWVGVPGTEDMKETLAKKW